MDYFEKVEESPTEDLLWNIPETKQGTINIIGGNSQNFRVSVKVAEWVTGKYPVEKVNIVLPDALQSKLPSMENFIFLKSTDSGSFAGDEDLANALNSVDFNLIIGDFSRNKITGKAVASACKITEKPVVITRDAVDLVAENEPEKILMNDEIIMFGSMAQMQKILRAVYYPKMLLLAQSLVQVVEVLHKFTLSYPVNLVTLHNGQILIAKNGIVKAVPIEKSGYSPMMFWSGEIAGKIAMLNMYNPNNFINATIAAVCSS